MTKQKLKEALNKLDHKALNDCEKYYDLVALYEAAQSSISEDIYVKLESMIKKADSEAINDILSSLLSEDFIYEEQGEVDNSELNLDRIFESEQLDEEKVHKIHVEKCYAKASGNPYYSLKDLDTGDFIGKKQRVSYKTKEKAKEKLHNIKTGQDEDVIDYANDLLKTPENESMEPVENLVLAEASIDEPEDISSDIVLQLGEVEVPEDDLSPEILQMIRTPLKSNGTPWAQTVAILKIYEHLIMNNERYVSRETILRESGVANWNREGEHSTWFTEFGILGLIHLQGNDLYAGPNLKGWVEGTAAPTGYWQKRDGSKVLIGPGNPRGIDLRPYCNQTVKTRPDQGMQPDRSHGKGDTTTADTQLKSTGIIFKDGVAEFPDSFFEDLNEDVDPIKDRDSKINKLYRQYMSLDEEASITEENIDDWGISHVCSMNGWSEDCVRKALLNK